MRTNSSISAACRRSRVSATRTASAIRCSGCGGRRCSRGATRSLSLSPTLTLFKRFTFSGLVDRRAGFVNLNANQWFQCVPTQNCRAINDPTAPLIDQARAIAGGNGIGAYLEDASFWKLRELSASYSIPEQYVARGGVR